MDTYQIPGFKDKNLVRNPSTDTPDRVSITASPTRSPVPLWIMMSHIKGGFAPYGKTGEGMYGSSWGKETRLISKQIQASVLELAKLIPFSKKQRVFNIGDYGAADGSASMTFIRDLIQTLRQQHGQEVEFQVIYEDQANNDFNSLFRRLSGIITDPPSYLLELDNVYPLASGIQFYNQCVPSDTMHFIMSTIAVHWLSRLPIKYKQSLYIYPDSTEEEKKALAEQARVDWETFLLMRSRELTRGGLLFVICSGKIVDEKGLVTYVGELFMQILTYVYRSFRDSSRITAEEFINTNFGFCSYSLEQLKTPFEDETSSVFHSGLRVILTDTVVTSTRFYSMWEEKKELEGVDDREEFARNLIEAYRQFSQNIFITGLSDDRSQQEKEDIVDDFFHAVEKQITKLNPEGFKNDQIYHYFIIRKE